jgi:putative DNA primase/helicase
MQRSLGRCLSGDITEQILPIWYGAGANGKSTIVTAILETMGPGYAMKANTDFLMQSRGDRHPTELASLFGMRLVVASETQQGRKLNEALVKDLTGGERLQARRMREDFWEFNPTHKVILLTNHKPCVSGTDDAIWRRLRLVPFSVRFWDPEEPEAHGKNLAEQSKQDKQLPEKLRAEREGILAWLVRGCLDWQRDGLTLPNKVQVATSEYRAAEDLLAQFLAECCIQGPDYRCRAKALYGFYKQWIGQESCMSHRVFGESLTLRGFQRQTSNGTWYVGLAILQEHDSGPEE